MAEHYPQSLVDEVLARTDLLATVEEYVQVQRKGGRFFGVCPFHSEKTPSFSVSPEQGLFYCFGCGAGGSAVQFLMRIESWSFPEALRELARRSGVRLPEPDSRAGRAARREQSAREAYFRVMEQAAKYYEAGLADAGHASARAYLRDRGVDEDTTRSFRLGYAPPGWQGLLRFMRRNNVSGEAVAGAGLALPRQRGGYYDRFRDRIMFPVVDRMGRVVGFSGRAVGSAETQKYINSPELPYFKKGEHLFGLQAAKEHLRKSRKAILVEGNFDVVTLHSAGFRTAVAPMGTALTMEQVRLLRRLADLVVIVFDGDEAGQRAMMKCVGPCYGAELEVRAATLPADSDPDSYVRERGAEEFAALLERAPPLAEVALTRHVKPAVGGAPEVRLRAARSAGAVLAQLPPGTLRNSYLRDTARRLEVPAAAMKVSPSRRQTAAEAEGEKPAVVLTPRERVLIQILADEPRLARRFRQAALLMEALRPELRPFVEILCEASTVESSVRLERVIDELDPAVRGSMLEAVSAERTYGDDRELSYENAVWQLQRDHLSARRARLQEEVRAAEHAGDEARLEQLWERGARLAKALAELAEHRPRI